MQRSGHRTVISMEILSTELSTYHTTESFPTLLTAQCHYVYNNHLQQIAHEKYKKESNHLM